MIITNFEISLYYFSFPINNTIIPYTIHADATWSMRVNRYFSLSSGSQHRCTRRGPIPRPKIRRASKMTGWSETRSTSSTASAAYLSHARSHSADRKGRTTEFRRCYPNCNNEGASRLWWWYIYGGEVAQSSWKCNKEQGIASRVDSGGSWRLRCTLDCLNVVHCGDIVEELV